LIDSTGYVEHAFECACNGMLYGRTSTCELHQVFSIVLYALNKKRATFFHGTSDAVSPGGLFRVITTRRRENRVQRPMKFAGTSAARNDLRLYIRKHYCAGTINKLLCQIVDHRRGCSQQAIRPIEFRPIWYVVTGRLQTIETTPIP